MSSTIMRKERYGQIVYKQMRMREGFTVYLNALHRRYKVHPYRSFAVKSLVSPHSGNEFFHC